MKQEIIGDCRLILGDCMEVLAKLEKVDAVITDPPYGDGAKAVYGLHDKAIAGNDDPLLNCRMLGAVYHCLRKNGSIYNFTNHKHVDFLKHYARQYTRLRWRHTLVWAKHGMGMGGAFRPAHELVAVLEKGKPFYRRKDFGDVQHFPIIQHDAGTHPHEKPLGLIKGMVQHSTCEGMLVLDPFMGSGTTAVACAHMGRRFVGIELDERYFEMACKRVEAAYRQPDLFTPPTGGAQQRMELEGGA